MVLYPRMLSLSYLLSWETEISHTSEKYNVIYKLDAGDQWYHLVNNRSYTHLYYFTSISVDSWSYALEILKKNFRWTFLFFVQTLGSMFLFHIWLTIVRNMILIQMLSFWVCWSVLSVLKAILCIVF
jgi:hypothetical protein